MQQAQYQRAAAAQRTGTYHTKPTLAGDLLQTIYKSPSRDGYRTVSETDGSVSQLYDAEVHNREELTCTINMLTRESAAKTIADKAAAIQIATAEQRY